MDEQAQIDRIESYYHRTMPADERIQFEKELETNPALHQLFREHVYFLDGLQGLKLEALEKTLRTQHTNNFSIKTNWFRKNWIAASIAAVIIVLIGLNWFFARNAGTSALAHEYYSTPFAEVNRSNTQANDAFTKGMSAFSRQKWQEAIVAFDATDSSHASYEQSLYFRAHAYAELQNFEKALSSFNELASGNGEFRQQAEWNALLMHMMLNHPKNEIRSGLTSFANQPDHFYAGKAKEILERINK